MPFHSNRKVTKTPGASIFFFDKLEILLQLSECCKFKDMNKYAQFSFDTF